MFPGPGCTQVAWQEDQRSAQEIRFFKKGNTCTKQLMETLACVNLQKSRWGDAYYFNLLVVLDPAAGGIKTVIPARSEVSQRPEVLSDSSDVARDSAHFTARAVGGGRPSMAFSLDTVERIRMRFLEGTLKAPMMAETANKLGVDPRFHSWSRE